MKKQDHKETIKKALFFTNAAYLVMDIVNTFATEADFELQKLQKCFNREDKQRINNAARAVKAARSATKIAAEQIYKMKDVDDACIDSDYLHEIIKLVINRTDDTEESMQRMMEHIKQIPKVEPKEV
jgi:uncharacterized membrane protein YhiD involved in acid resistance